MAHELWTVALLLVLAVVAALAAVIAGLWALGVSAVILLLLVVRVLTVQQGGWWWRWGAVPLGLLGGLVGMASALTALVAVGRVAGAGERVGWGWAAFALAALAAAGATVARARPRLACAALIAGSSSGMAAMSLFDINTFYVAAVPLCWIAAALALLGARPRMSGNRRRCSAAGDRAPDATRGMRSGPARCAVTVWCLGMRRW